MHSTPPKPEPHVPVCSLHWPARSCRWGQALRRIHRHRSRRTTSFKFTNGIAGHRGTRIMSRVFPPLPRCRASLVMVVYCGLTDFARLLGGRTLQLQRLPALNDWRPGAWDGRSAIPGGVEDFFFWVRHPANSVSDVAFGNLQRQFLQRSVLFGLKPQISIMKTQQSHSKFLITWRAGYQKLDTERAVIF